MAPATIDMQLEMYIVVQADLQGVNRAYVNGQTFPGYSDDQLKHPMLQDFLNPITYKRLYYGPSKINKYGSGTVPFVLPFNKTVEITLTNTDGGDHPFHLHGGDFWISECSDNIDTPALNKPYYLIRDTVTVPANGTCKILLRTINPGVWSFHCHSCVRMPCFLHY
jgi:iron transport multicopper oxidase